jgi:hypothetical protein
VPSLPRALVAFAALLCAACPSDDPGPPVWEPAFDPSSAGALSGVWGSGPDDVFIVGGGDRGEIYHYDGAAWSPMEAPDVGLLVWVFGFGPDDVWAVGVGGGVVHYDGTAWTQIDAGTTTDLWGVWGTSSSDLWIVGGSVSAGDPVILHHDGVTFTPHQLDAEANPLEVHALFKIFGVGSRLFAVGQRGLIVEYDGATWSKVSAGPEADEDFISLYGISGETIVAVGGRNTARIAFYNGSTFETVRPEGVFGLNAIFVDASGAGFIGGVPGFVAELDVGGREVTGLVNTAETIHAMWGDDQGTVYAVGGLFAPPYTGVALFHEE